MQDILKSTGHRPTPLPKRHWAATQRWNDLLFAHWPIAPEAMRPLVPPELSLDLFDGLAWIAVTPFHMSGVRARWLPLLPGLSAFPELNVRTYVTYGGKAGVYFRPGKIIQASKNLGVGVHAFEAAADYVQNYVQGGRILIKHQAVALRLADMATRIEAVRALLERAAQAVDDNAPDAETFCNMVKLFASEEILKVAQHCLELHGGNGVMLDFGVEKIFRDAAIFLHMDATVDISKLKIVKSMFPATAGKYAGPE